VGACRVGTGVVLVGVWAGCSPHQMWLVGGLAKVSRVPVISAPRGRGMVCFGKRSGGRNQADDLALAGGHDTAAFAACPRSW
jgi:hypothetical protein